MAETYTHKCPNCGGALTFEPEKQNFHCAYCGSNYTAQQIDDFEKQDAPNIEPQSSTSSIDSPESSASTGALDLFTCPNCGAEIVTEATTAATYCYYCHNPVVLTKRLSGEFLPDLVVPFAIKKEEAAKRFLEWAQKKRYAPKDFFNETQIEKMTGVYFPYWAVDGEVDGDYRAEGTRIRIWRTGEIEYTETKVYEINRSGQAKFADLVKNALNKNAPDKMVASVQPFPLEKGVPFKSQYLSGFQAEKRDLEYQAIKEEVNQELKQYTSNLLRDSAGSYTSVAGERFTGNVKQTTQKYVLLPVWLLTYHADDDQQTYYYALNGQTGKTSGVLPLNKPKLLLHAGGIALLCIILGLIGGFLI